MANLNKIMIIGNVGKEPEMRFTPDGKAVTSFSVAVNDKYGETEHTEWFRVTAWGRLAETCNEYLEKGQQVYVEGRIKLNQWDDNEGKNHSQLEINANQVVFLAKKKGSDEAMVVGDGVTELEPEDLPF